MVEIMIAATVIVFTITEVEEVIFELFAIIQISSSNLSRHFHITIVSLVN